jgi:thiol-disulfide isomerase/thioredoxin
MSGLLFLTSDDFNTQRGAKGPIMCTNIQGFSLVLFYSTQCEHCQSLIPIFKRLPGSVGGCQFGMINVSHNKQCVMLSRQTIAPIKEVPYILLYINGKPYMRYRGPHDPREIGRFIVEVSQKVNNNQNFEQDDKRVQKDPRGGIPAYTTGHPLCGPDEKVCYLEFETAYTNDNTGPGRSRPRQHLPTQAGMGATGRNNYG